jgi:type II secretion system protein J
MSALATTYRTRRYQGFTLIEVLIAVVIFSVVLAAINTTFYTAMRLRNKMTKRLESAMPLAHALSIMKRDLTCIMVPSNAMACYFVGSTEGNSQLSRLEFYTASAALDSKYSWGDVQKVAYYLGQPELPTSTNRFDFYRAITRNLLPITTEEYVETALIHGVDAVEFQFYDGTQWLQSWDSTTQDTPLPQFIRIALCLAPTQEKTETNLLELLVPVTIQSRTNSASSTNSSSSSSSGSTTTQTTGGGR